MFPASIAEFVEFDPARVSQRVVIRAAIPARAFRQALSYLDLGIEVDEEALMRLLYTVCYRRLLR